MNHNLHAFYSEYKKKLAAYQLAMSSISFDQATIAPKSGIAHSNEMLSLLAGDSFAYATDSSNMDKIKELYAQADLDKETKKEIELRLDELEATQTIPKDVYIDFQKAMADGQAAWEEAKAASDYQIFKPHLMSLIEKQKNYLSYIKTDKSSYNYLLDRFERGMSMETYDLFFDTIKKNLVPLIKKIQQANKQVDATPLKQRFSLEKQKEFNRIVQEYFKINKKECYLCESTHPFSSFFSAHDVRITTRYHEKDMASAILSTIHEWGHAQYGLQVSKAYEGTTLANNLGFAMHESQSRFLENHVGRSNPFWEANFPKLKQLFQEELADIDFDTFIEMFNASTPGFIRIEADELTYPLHVLVRYELEKEIFNDNIDCDNLNVRWADKYEEYLGIRPPNDAIGILQDMHWSAAYFGYFPTYALGSAFSAQFFNQVKKDIDFDAILKNGTIELLSNWLKENIHQYGASKTFDEILLDVTGETFNPKYYVDYLVDKYTRLYNL